MRLSNLIVLLVSILTLCGCFGAKRAVNPGDLVEQGWQHYRLGEFQSAIDAFSRVVEGTREGSDVHIQGLYGLATTWNLKRPDQDTDLARLYYGLILEQAPDSDMAAWSLLALARMEHLVPVGQDPDYDAVRDAYQLVIDRFPGHLAADESFIYLQSTYAASMDEDLARKALEALKEFVRENPDSGFVSAAYSLQAVCHEILNDPRERLDAELKAFETAEVDPQNPFQDNAWRYWNLAVLAEFNVGDFDTARKFYVRLIEEYPTDVRYYSAQKSLERIDHIEDEIRQELMEEM